MTIYVDPAVAGPGTGTIGDPYSSPQTAIDDWVSFAASGEIWIANTVPHNLNGTALSWASFAGGTSILNPLIFNSYDPGGGTQFWTFADGSLVPYGAITDNNVTPAATIFSTTTLPNFVTINRIQFSEASSTLCGTAADYWTLISCEFIPPAGNVGGSWVHLDEYAAIWGCKFSGVADTGGAAPFIGYSGLDMGTFGCAAYNYFENYYYGGLVSQGYNTIAHNVFSKIRGGAILLQGVANVPAYVFNNTLDGANIAGTSGLSVSRSAALMINNIFNDWSGAGSKGVNVTAEAIRAGGYNIFNNCTADIVGAGYRLNLGGDQTADPLFVSAATGNFEIQALRNEGNPKAFFNSQTKNFLDPGAVQSNTTSGGGGGVFPRNRYRGY